MITCVDVLAHNDYYVLLTPADHLSTQPGTQSGVQPEHLYLLLLRRLYKPLSTVTFYISTSFYIDI